MQRAARASEGRIDYSVLFTLHVKDQLWMFVGVGDTAISFRAIAPLSKITMIAVYFAFFLFAQTQFSSWIPNETPPLFFSFFSLGRRSRSVGISFAMP